MKVFEDSELVVTPNGEIYHLGIKPEDLAHKIIIVGDQDRVAVVSNNFDTITHKSQHREFACHTGMYKGKKISALSTGIGTDNLDIVINELDALVNIDLENRTEKEIKTSLEIVRLGTCGILQDDIPIDSFILSTHALGLDNVGHFYAIDKDNETEKLLQSIENQLAIPPFVKPYLTKASDELVVKLTSEKVYKGITVTASGFYGPQGRTLRIPLAASEMLDSFTSFKEGESCITNLEMECSSFFMLSKALGHHATGICLGLANRRKKEFTNNYESKIKELIVYVLDRI